MLAITCLHLVDTGELYTFPNAQVSECRVCSSAPFQSSLRAPPQGIWQPDANTVLIADRSNGRIRRFDLAEGRMTTFAGCGASAEAEAETERYFDNAQAIDQLEANLYAPSSVCQVLYAGKYSVFMDAPFLVDEL